MCGGLAIPKGICEKPNVSRVAKKACGPHLEWRIPQIEDLKAAVLAADQDDFATDAEVSAVVARLPRKCTSRTAAKPAPRCRAA